MRGPGRSTAVGMVVAVLAVLATLVPAPMASASTGYPWSVVPTTNPVGATETSLAGTSCTPDGFCMAVGSSDPGPHIQAFAERFQNSEWSEVGADSTSPNRDNALYGVSCLSDAFCTAVGQGVVPATGLGQTLVERWNGSGWAIVPSPDTDPDESQQLLSVSCPSVSSCVAVGSAESPAGTTDTLVETWNGSAWTIVGSPNAGSGGVSELDGVSCLTPVACTAVGYYFNTSVDQTLVETWNGSVWSIVASPDVSPTTTGVLSSDSCSGPTACTAVGYSLAGSTFQALAEQWNGTAWSIEATPDTAPTDVDVLQSVSCASPTSCTAVGSSSPDGSPSSNLIEQWDGDTWTITPGPPEPPGGGELLGVSCAVPLGCSAVGDSPDGSPMVSEAVSTRPGYWLVAGDGGIFSFGSSVFHGSEGGATLQRPVVGIAPTADRQGYWLVASDGGIFSFGDAPFEGSMGDKALNAPIVGIAPTADGRGYWMVASDGGIFSFGDAPFEGSMGDKALNAPIVGIAPTADGRGYWMVASDGGIFSFGDAPFEGSMGDKALNAPIVGIAPTPDGRGYWMVASDGGIFSFGDAPFEGSMGDKPLNAPIVGIAPTADGRGYWMVASDGGIFSFGDAPFEGSMGGTPLVEPIVGIG